MTGSDSLVIELDEFIHCHSDHLEVLFTSTELEMFGTGNHYRSLAARFLAKEIIRKNIGNSVAYTDIEILNTPGGQPGVVISNVNNCPINKIIKCSLSHSRNYAAALVVMTDEDDE